MLRARDHALSWSRSYVVEHSPQNARHFKKLGLVKKLVKRLLGLVRSGSLVMPPDSNVEKFDWSPGSSDEAEEDDLSDEQRDELDEQRRKLEAMLGLPPTEED